MMRWIFGMRARKLGSTGEASCSWPCRPAHPLPLPRARRHNQPPFPRVFARAIMGMASLRKAFWASIVILCCLASSADAAGIQLFNHGPNSVGRDLVSMPGRAETCDLGDLAVGVDYGLVGVKDCPVTGAKLPLVVFSHGTIGWFGGHHDTAAALADAGFVVAAINHPGDNAKDPREPTNFLFSPRVRPISFA